MIIKEIKSKKIWTYRNHIRRREKDIKAQDQQETSHSALSERSTIINNNGNNRNTKNINNEC